MKELSNSGTLVFIKDELVRQPSVIGLFIHGSFAKGTMTTDSDLELFVIVNEQENVDKTVQLLNSLAKQNNLTLKPTVWTIHEMEKPDNAIVQIIFREGKLIYWNSLYDMVASQIFKVRPYTLLSFEMKSLKQTEKAGINYQLYGKKNNGLLDQVKGIRVAKSCFYVPFSNKFKVIRFLNKHNLSYKTTECWI